MSFIGKQTAFPSYQGVKILPKQLAEDCGGLNAFCQPVEQADVLAFQMHAFESSEQVTDGVFQDVSDLNNWTNTGWGLNPNFISNEFLTVSILQQNNVFTVNNFYRITIDYELVNVSQVLLGRTSTSYAGFVAIKAFVNSSPDKTIRTTFTVYWEADAPHLILAGFGNPASSGSARIHSISVIEIGAPTDYTIEAIDLDGVVQGTIPSADISQVERNIVINSLWSNMSLANGCYQLRITSAYDVFNDTLDDNLGWFLVRVTIAGGVMVYNDASSGLAYIDVLEIGATYSVQFDVVNYVSGSVTMQAGNTSGTLRNANGTYTETVTCTGWGRLLFGFASGDLDIDNITASKVNNIDGYSECLNLKSSHACTKLLKWKNEENIMGFDFSNNFEHSMRILARFNGTSFPTDRLTGLSSAGLKTNDYSELRKLRVVELWYAREWVHDSIAGAFVHDSSLFDGIDYTLDEDYEPEPPNDGKEGYKYRGLMKGTLELDKKDQNLINRNE